MPGAFSSKEHFLFDLDGTLADSVPAHERAFIETLRIRHPVLAENFDYAPFAGQPTRQVFFALGFGDERELMELTSHKQQLYREAIERGDVTLFPGVESLLAQLQARGHRLFLVTGASRKSTRRILELTALAGYFEGIITAEDVYPGKPSPEPYLHVVTHFGLRHQACLVIEDGESGVRSAQSAGLDAVLIHTELQLPGIPNVGNCENLASLLLP
jgi:HAD superfamily hydrolase (TIGR01509 family)